MKRLSLLSAAVAATMVLGSASAASAQSVFLAPYGGYNVDGEELLVGAALGITVPVATSKLVIRPGFEFYPGMPDGSSLTSFLVDAYIPIMLPNSPVSPYVGGGYALNRVSVDVFGESLSGTNSQLNALGGVGFGMGQFQPYVEGNLRFIDGSMFILKAGGRISFGK